MGRRSECPAEVRERAVRLVFEQQGAHEPALGCACCTSNAGSTLES